MQQTKTLETWVGLFVALGMTGFFFLAMKVSNLADLQINDNSYRLIARFQNAGSLRERSPVSMAGVRIGRVSSIRFDKETYEAVVEMRIDPEYNTIPSDTTANVLTAGLLGEQYIGLSAGGSPDYLKNGDTIELSQSAMVLEEVISKFLFNKAESGAENKKPQTPAKTSAEDVGQDNAIVKETPAQAKMPEKPEEKPSAEHKAKPRKEKGEAEAEPTHAAKSIHGGAGEESRAAQKTKHEHGKHGAADDVAGKNKSTPK